MHIACDGAHLFPLQLVVRVCVSFLGAKLMQLMQRNWVSTIDHFVERASERLTLVARRSPLTLGLVHAYTHTQQ